MQAIQDDDPVVFFEPKRVYRAVKMDVPDTAYTVPLGEAKVVRTGAHVTCVAWGAMLYEAYSAAEAVAEQGVDVEVVDLRTLWPLDIDTLATSVRKTGRFVVVHEAPRTCGFGSELVALVTERAFLHLEAPPIRVTGWDTPFPLTHEREYLPLKHRIVPALLDVARY
jgi:2-oxoisovalerate dehydrogenase E1 component beta subunit